MAGLVDIGIGGALKGAGALAGGIISAAGSVAGGAISGAGAALGGALQGALAEGPKTIINNVGIAGTAGTQKVSSGGGTLPAPKKTAKPAYNEKMPTEKLLAVAIGYLASIDSTLRTQIENDRVAFQKKVQAEKESTIENKSGESVFSKLGDKLGAAGDYAKDKSKKWDLAGTLIKGTALFAGLAALGISKLDDSELVALKNNISAFKKQFDWLLELAQVAGGARIGFAIGGLFGPMGRIVGAIAGALIGYGFVRDEKRAKFKQGSVSVFSDEAKDRAAKYFESRSLFMANRGGDPTKKGFIESARSFMQGRAGTEEEVAFLKADLKKSGFDAKQIDTILFGTEEDVNNLTANAVPVSGNTVTGATAIATPSTGIKAKSETGLPEEAQAFFENKGWTKEQASGIVGNLFVESGLRTDAVGDGGAAYGIAQWHPDRQAIFQRQFGKPITESNFKEQLEFVNWELNNNEKAAGNALRGATTAADAAAIVDSQYERSSGAAMAQRQANATSIAGGDYSNLQGGGGSGGEAAPAGGFSIENTLSMAKKIFGKAGGALIGAENYKYKPLNEKIGDPTKKISDLSKKIEADTISGNAQEVAKTGALAATASQKSIVQASNDGTLGALDPNYPNSGDLIGTYLAHWKFAA